MITILGFRQDLPKSLTQNWP